LAVGVGFSALALSRLTGSATSTGAAGSAALGAGAALILAPKTTQAILSSPAATKTAVASAINPVAGLIVGAEQGTSVIKEAFETNKGGIIETGKEILTGVGLVAGGAAIVAGGTALYNNLTAEKETKTETPKVMETNTATPTLPQTQAVTVGSGLTSTKRKRRPSVKQSPQNIIQRTSILIQNRNSQNKLTTKKYLNAALLKN